MSEGLVIYVRPGGDPNGDFTGYAGWTRHRVTTGVETVPATFEIEATESYPGSASQIAVQPGMECYITIAGQRIVTGYIDRVGMEISGNKHVVRITGRSRCADLVDCSAEFSTFQVNNQSPVQLANLLCNQFNIEAYTVGDVGSTQIPQFDVILTETPYDVIERICRYAALLAYDDAGGNLVLTRVGSTSMASGFTQGKNVERASAQFTMDERFSYVEATILSVDTLYTQPGDPTSTTEIGQEDVSQSFAMDFGVPRYRPLIIVAEQGDLGYSTAQQRAQWEVNRRIGRSQQISIVCDSWTDSAGNLWSKNSLAPIDIPALKVTNAMWVICSVSFVLDEDGTHAEVTLMPGQALLPEPIILQPYAADVYQAVNPNGAAANTAAEAAAQEYLPPLGGAQ